RGRAIRHPELAYELRDVAPDSDRSHRQPLGDHGRRESLAKAFEHLPLAAREPGAPPALENEAASALPATELLDDAGRELPRQGRLAGEHAVEGRREAPRG